MKKQKYILYLIVFIPLLLSCSKDNNSCVDGNMVHIAVGMDNSRATPSKNEFVHNDSIGLFFWSADDGTTEPSSKEYISENNIVSLNYDVWVPASNMYWNSKKNAFHHFVGIYPYNKEFSFEDLSSLSIDNSEDFLLSVKKNVVKTTERVKLDFKHVLGKVIFNFEFKGFEDEVIDISALNLENVVSLATLNCYTAELTPHEDNISTMSLISSDGLIDNRCETVLIPQENVNISLILNNKRYTYNGDSINVKAAQCTKVNLRVNNLGEKITLSGNVNIIPWENGGKYDFELESKSISPSDWNEDNVGDI